MSGGGGAWRSMSSLHCVVVWEWRSAGSGRWLPHGPGVARQLERAHAKRLTRVVLADADPDLKGYYVNLRTLTQTTDSQDGESDECLPGGCPVRRACYGVQSAAGRGARWEWARGGGRWEPLPMEVQCRLEEAGGAPLRWEGWALHAQARAALRAADARPLRRVPQPPYPLARSAAPPLPARPSPKLPPVPPPAPPPTVPSATTHEVYVRTGCTGTGSSVQPASPRDKRHGLARQILHNLNIFSTGSKTAAAPVAAYVAHDDRTEDPESMSEGEPQRRHSVDTVSTYLSHESKDSTLQPTVGDLLNCSVGSDEVFDSPQPEVQHSLPYNLQHDLLKETHHNRQYNLQHDMHCDMQRDLQHNLHLDLQRTLQLTMQHDLQHEAQHGRLQHSHSMQQAPQHITCVAGLVAQQMLPSPQQTLQYQQMLLSTRPLTPVDDDTNIIDATYPECEECGSGCGRQPAGGMRWRVEAGSILVTYQFRSGRQRTGDPAPGERYYAVGFPRHTTLPDCVAGRRVLALLRRAWERGCLFRVARSQTTGREYVVAWCPALLAAPPAAPCTPRALARTAHALLHALGEAPHTPHY